MFLTYVFPKVRLIFFLKLRLCFFSASLSYTNIQLPVGGKTKKRRKSRAANKDIKDTIFPQDIKRNYIKKKYSLFFSALSFVPISPAQCG